MRITKLGATICLAAALASCSLNGATARADAEPARVVTIKNDNWMDVNVYVVRGSMRERIGTVTGLSTETLRVRNVFTLDGTVRFLLDPIGSTSTYLTDRITAAPGQRIELKVHNRLELTTFSVWNR